LLGYAQRQNHCWPSSRTLAEIMHKSEDTIGRYLAELEAKGYVTRQRRFGHSSITYIEDIEANPRIAALAQAMDESRKNAVTLPAEAREPYPQNYGLEEHGSKDNYHRKNLNVVTTAKTPPEDSASAWGPNDGQGQEAAGDATLAEAEPDGWEDARPPTGQSGQPPIVHALHAFEEPADPTDARLVPAQRLPKKRIPEADLLPDDDFQREFLAICGADRFKPGKQDQPTQKELVIAIGRSRVAADELESKRGPGDFYLDVSSLPRYIDWQEMPVPSLIPKSWWEWCKDIARGRHSSAWDLINYLCNTERLNQHCQVQLAIRAKEAIDKRKAERKAKMRQLASEPDPMTWVPPEFRRILDAAEEPDPME